MIWCVLHAALLIISYACHAMSGQGGTPLTDGLLVAKGITLLAFVITWPFLAWRVISQLKMQTPTMKWTTVIYTLLSGLFVGWFVFGLLRLLFPG
jgi:hypothetical protein